MIHTITHLLSRYARNEEGSVFVLVAVAAFLLITVTGVAVDTAREEMLQQKISSALDAAGLAAGATANSIDVQTQAQKYFNANFPTGYMGSSNIVVTATLGGTNNDLVMLTATGTQATTFLHAVGINSVNVAVSSQITRASEGMELALVLDNTGSMADPVNPANSSTPKIQALQTAITGSGGLLDILYGTNTTLPNFWIGVVPFTDMVNIGTGHSSWMDTTYDSSLNFGPVISGSTCPKYNTTSGTHYNSPSRCSYSMSGTSKPSFGLSNWGGCVTARSATTNSPTTPSLTLDASDDVPSSSVSGTLFQAFFYPSTATTVSSNACSGGSNAWECSKSTTSHSSTTTQTVFNAVTSTTGPNTNCIQTAVMGMTATKGNVVTEVNSMVAGGSTMINLGMSWGFRMLSPNWNGLWGGEMNATGNTQFPSLPLAYNTPLMNKVLILMTDGMDNTSADAGYIGQSTPADSKLDSDTEAICDTLKSNGVIIYTIGFGTTDDNDPSNPTSVDGPLLKYCATQIYSGDTSHYFLAPTNSALAGAFTEIGASLANLRVSQ
jgi:Flp pilus assembly protein TadG